MSHETPDELRYSKEHEWVRTEGDQVRIGITDFAQDALTDVVYVELPAPGDHFKAGEAMGLLESVKSVSDLYAPAGLTVVEVNDALEDTPDLINSAPYGDGWMILATLDDASALDDLLDAAGYRAITEGEDGA